jgi:hypothetical protein
MSWHDDELTAKFDDTMRAQLPPDKLAQTWPQLTGLGGIYESCGDPIVRPFGEHTIVNAPMEFEGGPMTGHIVFDADGRIAVLFVLFVLRPGLKVTSENYRQARDATSQTLLEPHSLSPAW